MYIRVVVQAGMKREELVEEKEHYFRISVKEKAERNLANNRVREKIGEHFGIPTGAVRIISGHHSGTKMISIDEKFIE